MEKISNEEKALQIKDDEKAEMIAYSYSHPLRCERCGAYIWEAKDSADTAFKAAMAMAKWKDEDFAQEKQALIDKACKWPKDNKEHPLIGCEDTGLSGFLTEEFIEDFKNYMKGGKE